MSKATRATQALEKEGIVFSLHAYDYDHTADNIGLQAAAALGAPPAQVLKTLMTLVDGKAVCAVVPCSHDVSMKKLAVACGAKAAQMMMPANAERFTGYRIGGISPFAQTKRAPVVIDAGALAHAFVYVNGGQRGLQIRLSPADLRTALAASVADLTA